MGKSVSTTLCLLIGCIWSLVASSCQQAAGEPPPPVDALGAALEEDPCPAGYNRIDGTAGDDVLVGTQGDDCIVGLEGDDTLDGGNGNDILVGGPGNDTLLGGNADDLLYGGDGNDVLDGGNGNDVLLGGLGSDSLMSHNGSDEVDGGPGNDVIHGGKGDDDLSGSDGNDVIVGGGGNDTSDGGGGTDACQGDGCEQGEPEVGECGECGPGQQCIESTGVCVYCIDDAECTGGDACNAPVCQPLIGCGLAAVPDGTSCSDADVCNGDEACAAGACQGGSALDCDDALECTADACDAIAGCSNTPVDSDGDGSDDCVDGCPADQAKQEAGECGCGVAEDENGNGVPDCNETEVCSYDDIACGGGPIGCMVDGVCEVKCSAKGTTGSTSCAVAACQVPCATSETTCSQEVIDVCPQARPQVCRDLETNLCEIKQCDTIVVDGACASAGLCPAGRVGVGGACTPIRR